MRPLIFLLPLLLVACKSAPPARPAFPVTVAAAEQRDLPLYVDAIGTVYSLQTVQVRPQVGGIITEAYVKQGQYVKKGDKLYQIDPRPYQAALDQAKAALIKDTATLAYTKTRVERYADIVKKEFLSKLDYESYQSDQGVAEGQVLSDQAAIDIAQLNLEWTTPISPIDGKISQYNIDPGNLVIVNDANALTNIRQIDPIDIRFGINQKDFIEVQKVLGGEVLKFIVTLPQDPTKTREGTIYFIDNTLDQTTGTILMKGTAPNADEMFWPGEFVRIKLQLKILHNAVVVPQEAVNIGQQGSFVYVFHPETSKVEYRLVDKGETLNQQVVITKGVTVGEKVVTQGQVNIRPNATVELATTPAKKVP